MKKGKRLLALVIAVSLVTGLAPMSSTSYAEETESAGNEVEGTIVSDTAASYATTDVTSELGIKSLVYMDASDETNPLTLYGLTSQEGASYARMDLETAADITGNTEITYDNSVYTHARESAGGRVRFTTTSPYIAIKAVLPYYNASYEAYASDMGAGKYGFDVYLDTDEGSVYYGTIEPEEVPTEGAEWTYEGIVEFDSEEARNITIYFPITHEVSEVYVGAKNSSVIVPNLVEYEDKAPIVYYGSSITQGGCVTKPGNTYVNTIGRMLNRDYINLGVWGSAKGQTAFANYIANLDMSIFVFDYDHNAGSAQALENTHYAFYEIIRNAHPNIPIVFITRPNQTNVGTEGDTYEDTWKIVKGSYDKAKEASDNNVYFIDGQSFFTVDGEFDSSYLSDGIHPTDAGQARMAEVIGGQLQDLIEAMPAETNAYNETVLLTDTFNDGTSWDTTPTTTKNAWRVGTLALAGPRNGVAPLGYGTVSNRNLYYSKTNDGKLTNVHIKADVCITSAVCTSKRTQCYYLLARASAADPSNGIVFGFQTLSGATKSSLVVANYENKDYGYNHTTEPLYKTDAVYDFNTAYTLELFVVDKMVIAKCNGEVIFSQVVESVNSDMGYCGIIDRRASSQNAEGATKGGYFDNFSISTITFDGFEVEGNVVCEANGIGIADVMVTSGDASVSKVEDVDITVLGFADKQENRYDSKQLVEITLCDTTQTAVAETVYVVSDMDKAVTKMSDPRWTGSTTSKPPLFEVNGTGVATLTPSASTAAGLSMLNANGDGTAGKNFYVEYVMTVSGIESEKRTTIDLLLCNSTYGTVASGNAWDTIFFFDQRASQAPKKTFWARMTNLSSAQISYSDTFEDTKIGLNIPMTVGMLVDETQVAIYINGEKVITDPVENASGWFGISQSLNQGGTVTIEDFLYVPIASKALADIEVDTPSKVQLGKTFEASVTPVYTWPNEKGETTAEGVTTNFDNTKLGVQHVSVTYGGITKEVKVEVVNYEPVVDEDFTDYTFSSDDWKSNTGISVTNNQVVMAGNASAYVADSFANGFIEATVSLESDTLDEWEATETTTSKTIYPMVLARQVDSKNDIKVRFKITKNAAGNISAVINTFVRDGDTTVHSAADYKLTDFAWGTKYTLRLTVIGNYVEIQLNGTVIKEIALDKENVLVNQEDTRFGFENVAEASATLDDLLIGKYTVYTVDSSVVGANEETESTVDLPSYSDYIVSSTKNQRAFFLEGEEIMVTINAGEGEQLAAAGGLLYTIGEVPYVIDERLGEAGETPEISNQFVFAMPSSDITVKATFVNTTQANMGIRSVSIREQQDTLKPGLRFSSRAYKQYTTTENVEYTLSEVGTLVFKEGIEVTSELLNGCYQNVASNATYTVDDTVVGKKVVATKAQDVCDDYIDWGLVLTYEENSSLVDTKYTAYSYAVYVNSSDGTTQLVFAENPKTYSYSEVATLVGYQTH